MIDGYRLEEVLGEGASGIVYAARAPSGERVAVKVLRHERTGDAVARARFLREARIAASLESRHLVPIVTVGETAGATYLVMPFYGQRSLAHRLRDAGPLDLAETVTLAAQMASGLDALHERGILHRDIKPPNVLLDDGGSAALSDFGLAWTADSTRLTEAGNVLGTLHYLAPELIEGAEATAASDIYAVGCVLYECVCGSPPFGDAAHTAEIGFAHLVEEPADPRERQADLPEDVAVALLSALSKDPAERPTTATALARMLHLAHKTALA